MKYDRKNEYARKRMNAIYREAGWGKIAHAALGIEPFDTEAQARDVARWAHHHLVTPTAYSMERAAKLWWDKSNAGIFGTVSWEALPEHVRQEKIAYMHEFWHQAAAMLVEDGTTPAKGDEG